MKNNISAYYDNYKNKFIREFVWGNKRLEAAVKFALKNIDVSASSILDIGCGVGSSSWEIKRHFKRTKVVGIDISSDLIETAKKIFGDEGIEFKELDVTTDISKHEGKYDVIVMLDVYEHIPDRQRDKFHNNISSMLSDKGTVILTFPSGNHQEYLKKHYPSRLQPVDETIERRHIEYFAEKLGCKILEYEKKSIWSDCDYVHACLSKTNINASKMSSIKLEKRKFKINRIEDKLDIFVMKEGIFLPRNKEKSLCVVTPRINAYSETFINHQLERLPANIKLLYGNPMSITHKGLLVKKNGYIKNKLVNLFVKLKKSIDIGYSYLDDKILSFMGNEKIDAVLAQYGPTGVGLLDICKKLCVPLIIHFHGYDAFDKRLIEKNKKSYCNLFQYASAIISVSKDMSEQLRKLGAPENKIYYNPYGVDLDEFKYVQTPRVEDTFIAVGRFVDKKAPHLTIMAFNKLLNKKPGAKLVMIGDGPLLAPCRDLAKALGIFNSIEFKGVCSHSEVAKAMYNACAFVQHSIVPDSGDSEGTPVAIIEAQASGLPVIATRHAGIKDVVIEGETGFLVNERDIDSMTDYMLRVTEEPDLADTLGKNGRKRIAEKFSMEKSINNLWAIIKSVIDK